MDRGTVYKPSPPLPSEQPEPYTAGRLKDQQTGFPVPVQHLNLFLSSPSTLLCLGVGFSLIS